MDGWEPDNDVRESASFQTAHGPAARVCVLTDSSIHGHTNFESDAVLQASVKRFRIY